MVLEQPSSAIRNHNCPGNKQTTANTFNKALIIKLGIHNSELGTYIIKQKGIRTTTAANNQTNPRYIFTVPE
ncbi:unnamed protein product [Clavelina lepadiformis]|uniref:Uncharacterized protein n=1 Tax=Clavelina lepadiformis TaxID=159417 RepID=A0ABP0GK97_CLALP